MKKMIVFLALIPAIIEAQAAFPYNVETSLSRSETYVGQTVYLTFSLQTEEKPILQPLRRVYGLEFSYQGENVSTQMTTTIVNGQRNSKTVYHYRFTYAVTPLESGVFVIPQTVITVGTTECKTSPVKLTVKEVESNENFRLILIPDCGEKAYNGQTMGLTVEMEISSNIDNLEIRIPFLKYCKILPADPDSTAPDAGNVKINETYYPFRRETAVRDRAVFSAYLRLIAKLPDGQTETFFDFSEATASFRAVTSTRESVDMFGRTVKDNLYTSVVIPADSGGLRILPLPQPQPADFSGIVGTPQLTAEADIREAYVGDPITYRLTVSGEADIPSDLLPLNKIESFTSLFRIPEHHSPALRQDGKTVFVYTIRPLSDRITEIPEYKCTVFNPETERYETVTAPALPLTVSPSPSLSQTQIEEFFPGEAGGEKITLEQVKNRIPAAETGKKLLYAGSRFPFGKGFRIFYFLLFFVTAVPFLATAVLCFRKSRPATLDSRRREFLKAVRSADRESGRNGLLDLLNLSESYGDVTAVYPKCEEAVSRLKYQLFAENQSDREETEKIFDLFEEALR